MKAEAIIERSEIPVCSGQLCGCGLKGSLGLHVGSFFLSFFNNVLKTSWIDFLNDFDSILGLCWEVFSNFFRSQNEVLLQSRFNIDFCSISNRLGHRKILKFIVF